ncbi:MAG: class I SAM-dependent methyltransferase [Candidatus Ranarchaeia archaeon]
MPKPPLSDTYKKHQNTAQTFFPPSFLRRQATMVAPARHFIMSKSGLGVATWALDLGCGQGYTTAEMASHCRGIIIGIDIDIESLRTARQHHHKQNTAWIVADAHTVPFRSSTCPLVLAHFILMWVRSPKEVVRNIRRILVKGGYVVGLEPDYSGRIIGTKKENQHPKEAFSPIVHALKEAGAHPFIGHRLIFIYGSNNFDITYYGVLAWEYNPAVSQQEVQTERDIAKNILGYTPSSNPIFIYTPVFL